MTKYIIKRFLIAIPVFLGITVLVYFMSSMTSGSPAKMILQGPNTTAEDIAELEERLGLDQPVYIQYARWAGEMFRGNLGMSYRTNRPVTDMIAERIGPTLVLTLTSLAISLLISIPLGTLAAYKPYTGWDYVSSGFAFFGAAMPAFFAALVFIYIFCVQLHWLPTGGMYDSGGAHTLGALLRHLILPAVTLAISQMGSYIRQVRSSVLEVLNEDYVRTARSKGLGERAVVFVHAMRNALIPVVTQVGMSVPFLVGGAVVTEQIFGWPGLGSLMVQSIGYRDYPTIMGITTVIALAVLVCNLLVDIIYGLLDPRIRLK